MKFGVRTGTLLVQRAPVDPLYDMIKQTNLNVLGEPLVVCGCDPLTGFYRDGNCRTGQSDAGQHTVCAIMDQTFLDYTKSQGNDLSTPVPQFGFPGLKPGDHWCLCASRWFEAYHAGVAPRIKLESTEISATSVIPMEILEIHGVCH